MTNRQGSLGQYNSNANIQNEANPHGSLGAPVFISTSSSHTESIQRFPDDLSGPNFLPHQERVNIIPSNDRGAGVFRRDIDLNAEYVENNHYPNQNVSVGLSVHPYKPDGLEDQSDSNNSDSMAIDSGNSYIVDEQGVDSSSVNMRFLSCNRSPEHACRELLIGESSSTAVQARNPISQAATSQVNASNSLNMSAPHIGPPNVHQQQLQQFSEVMYGSGNIFPVSFEAGIGRGTTRPFYDGLHFNNARQNSNSLVNIHHQIAANPQAFVSSGMLPMGHTRNYQVNLPTQRPWYHQDFPSFYSQAQTSVGTLPYVQPFVRVPDFHETLQASPWADVMGPRSIPAPFSPVYNVRRGGTVEPFYNPHNNSRNIMLGPRTGRAVQSSNLANMNYGNVTANYLGNFASSSHHGSFSGSHLSNTPTGAGNHSLPASSHSPLNLGPSAVSQEMGLTIGFGNARSQNQHRTVPRSDNQSGVNTGPPISAEARSNLVAEVQNTLQHLRNGGSMRIEELLILDYSLLLFLLEEHNNHEDDDDENEENAEDELGLSEEHILIHLRHATFQSSTEETPENVESCCICQEDYADGEDIGVLDCRHKFHFDCIKKWLEIKNNCPICKQTGLAAIDFN